MSSILMRISQSRMKMGIVVVEPDQGPSKLGKFPDYLTKTLKYPGGGKVRAAITGVRIAYKAGPAAWKGFGRHYSYKYRKQIIGTLGGGGIVGSILESIGPSARNDQKGRNRCVSISNKFQRQHCYSNLQRGRKPYSRY